MRAGLAEPSTLAANTFLIDQTYSIFNIHGLATLAKQHYYVHVNEPFAEIQGPCFSGASTGPGGSASVQTGLRARGAPARLELQP